MYGPADDEPCKFINAYQPAGKIEDFLREVGNLKNLPTREDVLNKTVTQEQISSLHRVFDTHNMDLLPPPGWE